MDRAGGGEAAAGAIAAGAEAAGAAAERPARARLPPELPVGTALPDLDAGAIMRILPHRFPMLMLDRLVGARAFERAVGIKAVSVNEPYFQGHFPGDPVMPGVLLVEALAQAAAALALASLGERAFGQLVYFLGVDGCRFRRPVRPGDTLRLEVELRKRRLKIWRYECCARVDGEVAAEAVLTAKLAEGDWQAGPIGPAEAAAAVSP